MWLHLLTMVGTFIATSLVFWLIYRKEHNEALFKLQSRGHELPVRVRSFGPYLEIMPEGYGEYEAEIGCGAPVFLDWYDETLRVRISPDINNADKQTIALAGANENLRDAAEPCMMQKH